MLIKFFGPSSYKKGTGRRILKEEKQGDTDSIGKASEDLRDTGMAMRSTETCGQEWDMPIEQTDMFFPFSFLNPRPNFYFIVP
jgi:hypothetical protein